MTTSNNKGIITDETMRIRELISSYVTFLSSNEFSLVFNISSSNANTNLSNRRFFCINKFFVQNHT